MKALLKKRTLSITILTSLLLILAVPVVVNAQVVVGGTGTLQAQGDGTAAVQGAGTVTISGNGGLIIYDRDGDATIEISGVGQRSVESTRNGRQYVRYIGFNGTATITGESFTVILRGTGIELNAEGTGRAWLKGRGTYIVNGNEGEWSAGGTYIDLGP